MPRLLWAALILSLVFCAALTRGAEQVVLVVGEDSSIEDISSLELRKAFFGITVRQNNQILRPLRNSSDAQLNEIFLQSVVAMSERAYERRLFSLALKYGRPRPEEFTDHDDLVRALHEQPNSISYMWRSDAERSALIRIIKLLWQEN